MQPQLVNIPQDKIIPDSQIKQGRFLGKGSYGRVYKAKWNGATVAVKWLISETINSQTQEEITTHLNLNHPRIIRLFGVIAKESFGIVMDYAANSSLSSFLESTKQKEFSWSKRKIIAMNMCGGLQYLQERGITHGNLKGSNVLLDVNFHAILADFGLFQLRSQTSGGSKTDVYALGTVLWELAIHDTDTNLQGKFPPETNTPEEYKHLTELCWAQNPNDQPTLEKIQELLDKLVITNDKPQIQQPQPDIEADLALALQHMKQSQYAKALPLLEKAAEQNHPVTLYQLGFCYEKGFQDYIRAAKYYLLSAELGYANAQNSLGILYEKGLGVDKDHTQAEKYYRLAAEQGYFRAEHNLGRCYEKGIGVDQDFPLAFKYFLSAASKEDAHALNSLGYFYEKGLGVDQDHPLAFKYYSRAAKKGYARAESNLGYCYEMGYGVAQNYTQAFSYYLLAAKKGNPIAQNSVGFFYRTGRAVTQNFIQALHFFHLAAKQDHARAKYNLGFCYYNGLGVDKDHAQAAQYFKAAADQGDTLGQAWLGYCYYNGHGVPKNCTQAMDYYKLAAAKGNADAQYDLGVGYYNGHGVPQDQEKAVEYFHLSAEQKNAEAQYSLGYCYENGHGVKTDKTKAKYYYNLAATQGNSDAQSALRRLGGK